MGSGLELVARLLVDVRTLQDGKDLLARWQRDGAADNGARALDGADDLFSALVNQGVVVRLELDSDGLLCCHL